MQTPPTQPDASPAAPAEAAVMPALPVAPLGAASLPGQAAVVELLQALGRGHSLLAQFRAAEAVAAFGALPAQQYQTAWVLSQVGKAYFELVNYAQALTFYTWARNQDPYRVEGLEWHSTVLWHMKKEARRVLFCGALWGWLAMHIASRMRSQHAVPAGRVTTAQCTQVRPLLPS
jgi:tetratricopeptide (TPR) repeat protein